MLPSLRTANDTATYGISTARTARIPIFGISAALVFASMLFFAFYDANREFRSDEVWSVDVASRTPAQVLAAVENDVHPPLYFFALAAWIRLFGSGEHAARSLSALFYIATGLAVFACVREFQDRDTALICAAVYLTSPLAIFAAQFVRMYALLGLVSALSTWMYLRLHFLPKARPRDYLLYTGANILGAFTHIWFFFLLIAHALAWIPMLRKRRWALFSGSLIASLIPYVAIWVPVLLRQISTSHEADGWIPRPNAEIIAQIALMFGGVSWLVLPALLFARRRAVQGQGLLRINLFLLSAVLLIPLAISLVKPILITRCTVVALPLFAIVVGSLLSRMQPAKLASTLAVMTVAGLVTAYARPPQCGSRAAAEFLREHANNGDIVIFTHFSRQPTDYYLQRSGFRGHLSQLTFPSAVDSHPGYEGNLDAPGRIPEFRAEAARLAASLQGNLKANAERHIFFFGGVRPALDRILEESLDRDFSLSPSLCWQCATLDYYYDRVRVYHRR